MPRENTGPKLYRRPDGVYEIRFTEEGRSRRYSAGTSDRGAAELALGAFLTERRTAKAAPAPADTRTVAWVLDRYMERRGDAARSHKLLAHGRRMLIAHLGEKLVLGLELDDFAAYTRARVKAGVSPPTVRNELTVLQSALSLAVQHRELPPGAAIRVPKPAGSKPREAWLTEEQVTALLAALRADAEAGGYAQRRLEFFAQIALRTGARKESLIQMKRGQVSLRAGTIDTRPFYTTPNKRGALIPISRELRPWVERALEDADFKKSNYLLGTPVSVSRALERLGARLGFHVHPHLFRHTFASLALQNGVSLESVAGVLGDTVALVERVYARHIPGRLQHAVDWLDDAALRRA